MHIEITTTPRTAREDHTVPDRTEVSQPSPMCGTVQIPLFSPLTAAALTLHNSRQDDSPTRQEAEESPSLHASLKALEVDKNFCPEILKRMTTDYGNMTTMDRWLAEKDRSRLWPRDNGGNPSEAAYRGQQQQQQQQHETAKSVPESEKISLLSEDRSLAMERDAALQRLERQGSY